jgi:hydroxymethylbilane synthase
MKYTIATRGSKLALYQANFVQSLLQQKYPRDQWEIETFTTTGDRFLDRPLSDFGGKGAFLKELEEALLNGKASIAVHSLKDVPATETPGLTLAAYLPREDPRDVWVSEKDDLMHVPAGSRIGTSSLRRTVLLRFYRPDLTIELLRGNLDTRLRKLKEHQYDAIIVAAAGLHRLKLFDPNIMHYLYEGAFVPAIGQGIMVVQTRKDSDLNTMLAEIGDSESRSAAEIERKFLERFEGGCHLPIGGYANNENGNWHFRAFIGGARSGKIIQETVTDQNPDACHQIMYERLLQQGARELLAEL